MYSRLETKKRVCFRYSLGNATASMRWNHLFNDRLFVNTSVIFSDYNFSFSAEQNDFEFKLSSGITDWNTKVDFSYLPNYRHSIKFGSHFTYHTFVPGSVSGRSVKFHLNQIKFLSNTPMKERFIFRMMLKLMTTLKYTQVYATVVFNMEAQLL